jgi:DNA-binding transcriptional MerR regulator
MMMQMNGGQKMEGRFYQIDEVARLAETTKRTIRYYEDLGLFKPARTDASYRLYTEDDIDLIKEILNLKSKLGMNLSEIQRFTGLKKTIRSIQDGTIRNSDEIRAAEKKLNELLVYIDEREATLNRVRNNCRKYLEEIGKTSEQLEK